MEEKKQKIVEGSESGPFKKNLLYKTKQKASPNYISQEDLKSIQFYLQRW